MSSDLLIVLTIFVALTAIAMIGQAVALFGIARATKKTMGKLEALLPDAAKVLESAQRTISHTGEFLSSTNTRTTEILDVAKGQITKIDDLVTDVSARIKVQLDRAEMALDDAVDRAQQTVGTVQRGVLAPIREVHGVLSGIRAAISALARGSRPTVDHATSDEEMFI
jgi:hypothetical protein